MIKTLARSIVMVALVAPSAGAALSALTTDDIVHLAESNSGVTPTLHALPRDFREMFLLAFAPRGNQAGSAHFPRGFYFGRHAVLAYGACPGARNLDAIELIDLRAPVPRLIELDFSRGHLRTSVNPAACLSCHGRDVRPLWPSGTATHWEGFYGGGRARLTQPWEDQRLAEFQARAKTHPRYASIPDLDLHTAYMNSPRGIYALNAEFEDVIAAAVVRRTMTELREHPIFRRALIPLLAVLGVWRSQGRDVIPFAEYARVLAPYLAQSAPTLTAGIARRVPRIEALSRDHARREWRVMELATGIRPTPAAQAEETNPRYTNVMTVLAYITEIFGLHDFDRSMSTSRTGNPFGIPALPRLDGALLRLEQALFDEGLALTHRTASELGRVPGWARDPRRLEFSQWPGLRELEDGLGRLAEGLGRSPSCADFFR